MGALALGCAVAFSTPAAFAQEKPIETIKKSGDWVVNFDENSCDLLAEFGTPKDPMVLKFTRYLPGDDTDLMITGRRLQTGRAWFEASVDFGLGDSPIKRIAAGIMQAKRPGIMMTGVYLNAWGSLGEVLEVTPAREAAITGVVIRVQGKKPFRLQFGPLDRPMKVMRQCLTDLVKSWGYDPAAIKVLRAPARPASSPASWVSDNDYPTKSVMEGHSGLLRFRLDIDGNGKVAGCHILDRTDPDDFSSRTCNILTNRARFTPALDANGKPTRHFYVGTFNWKVAR